MPVTVVPILTDNYVPLIHDKIDAIVVDPGAVSPVLQELEAQALTLKGILLTHHHWDHQDGALQLVKKTGATIYGAYDNRFNGCKNKVKEGDTITIGRFTFDVIETPGHTRSHLTYYCREEEALFTGDTLFSCGCGRLFEGDAKQMTASFKKLLSYPNETKIYFAHEYTLENLAFAHTVEPSNEALISYRKEIKARGNSIPSTIEREKECNPFCRLTEQSIRSLLSLENGEEWEVFQKLRTMKDCF